MNYINSPQLLPKESATLNYELITDDQGLQRVCEQAQKKAQVALDTEFVRTRTYYPQLGLIQLYDGEHLSLIDPLSIHAWQPFTELLLDPHVMKFLHAGSEDLEVFVNAFGLTPSPLIDTQIVASFIGASLSTGFATLVAQYLQVELDKSESRTDWLARPLTEKQCFYAAADVFYLLPLANLLLQACQQKGWLQAAQDECEAVCRRRIHPIDVKEVYKSITNVWQLQARQLACLQYLAEWRINTARERDIAINFVVKEENLWQVARYMPSSLAELHTLGLSGSEIRYHGNTLLMLVSQARKLATDQLPVALTRLVDHPDYKSLFKEIKLIIQQVAEQHGLTAELLASRRHINQLLESFLRGSLDKDKPELLAGWRADIMGEAVREKLAKYQ